MYRLILSSISLCFFFLVLYHLLLDLQLHLVLHFSCPFSSHDVNNVHLFVIIFHLILHFFSVMSQFQELETNIFVHHFLHQVSNRISKRHSFWIIFLTWVKTIIPGIMARKVTDEHNSLDWFKCPILHQHHLESTLNILRRINFICIVGRFESVEEFFDITVLIWEWHDHEAALVIVVTVADDADSDLNVTFTSIISYDLLCNFNKCFLCTNNPLSHRCSQIDYKSQLKNVINVISGDVSANFSKLWGCASDNISIMFLDCEIDLRKAIEILFELYGIERAVNSIRLLSFNIFLNMLIFLFGDAINLPDAFVELSLWIIYEVKYICLNGSYI